jgi:subtilisin family serine protease
MTAPACIHAAVAVGAVYSRSFGSYTAPYVCRDAKTLPDQVACFSNSGTELDLLAAGAPVDAAGLGSGDSLLAGTSVASAQASGAAAALLQADPALTPEGLLSLLESTGVPITDPRNSFTTPRIDLAAALGAVLGHPVPLPPPLPGAPEPVATPTLSAPTVPRASLSTIPISFGSVALTRAVTRRLVVRNSGTGYLTVRVATSLDSVSARPAKLTIPSSGRGAVLLTFRPVRAGAYRGQLRLQTDDPSAARITVAVRGTGRS